VLYKKVGKELPLAGELSSGVEKRKVDLWFPLLAQKALFYIRGGALWPKIH
jgi:hypothetical protein